jgi:hypothetical protein
MEFKMSFKFNVDDLTVGQLKEIQKLVGCTNTSPTETSDFPIALGENVMIRTVTMIQVGKLVHTGKHELVLENAAWVADTGRFNEFLAKGSYNECEPFPDGKVVVGRGAIVDACVWKHDLIRKVK